MKADTAHAVTQPSDYWLRNDIESNSYPMDKRYQRGQCTPKTESFVTTSGEVLREEDCSNTTPWGGIFADGYIRTGLANPFAKLVLPEGQKVLSAPGSDRLFIKVPNQDGTFRVAYLNSPAQDVTFHTISNTYTVTGLLHYIGGSFSAAGFSNSSKYFVGITSNAIVRIYLPTMARTTGIYAKGSQTVATISDNGLMAFSSTNNGTMYFYDLRTCMVGANEPSMPACAARMVAESTMPAGYSKQSIYLREDDGSLSLTLYSYPLPYTLQAVYLNVYIEKQTVTYGVLGDSFIAGEGTFDYRWGMDGSDEYPDEKCHQSDSSYPSIYGQKYPGGFGDRVVPGARPITSMGIAWYWDVSCSGARIYDISENQKYEGQFGQFQGTDKNSDSIKADSLSSITPGRIPQIEFLREYHPTMATISIGGNDVGFSDVIGKCLTSKCMDGKEGEALKKRTMTTIYNLHDKLAKLYNELHDASPDTRLFVVGYPSFISDAKDAKCSINGSFDSKERKFVKESLQYLNTIIASAAKKAGITYLSIENSITGHELCRTDMSKASYMNGVVAGNDIKVANLKIVGQETFHPKTSGYNAIADHMDTNYNELILYKNPSCPDSQTGYCPNATVSPPGFILDEKPGITLYKEILRGGIVVARTLFLNIDHPLKRGSKLGGVVYSDPRSLGTVTVDANGNLTEPFILPDDLEPGYHTLVVSGTLENGEPFEYTQLFFYAPEGTSTGPCGYLPYSNIDQDGDGIDDACDPSIDVENELLIDDPESVLIYPNRSKTKVAQNSNSSSADQAGQSSRARVAVKQAATQVDGVEGQDVSKVSLSPNDKVDALTNANNKKSHAADAPLLLWVALGGGAVLVAVVGSWAVYRHGKK